MKFLTAVLMLTTVDYLSGGAQVLLHLMMMTKVSHLTLITM